MADFDYDLFVIGGGSGGVRAARVAAGEAGAKVALAEEDRYGGTCVIRGCVPKKLMVFASEYAEVVEDAANYGWRLQEGPFDWPSFRARLNTELDRLEGVYRSLLKNSGVDSFDARATIKDAHTVALSTGETFTAKHILVATGGRPVRPEVPNADLGLVSDDIFHMEELPKRILIVGGGYIACEFACILHGLGVEVTQYYRGAQVLRGFDEEARGLISDAMNERGIDLHLGTDIVAMRCATEEDLAGHDANGIPMGAAVQEADYVEEDNSNPDGPIWVKSTNGKTRIFDKVFFATGRAPNTPEMGLEEVGVKLGRKGEIEVDDYSQTAVPSIYAIGDVTDRVNLTPVAIREGMAFVETVFKGNPTPVDHDLIPSAIFTQPEFGTVGLSEEQAREQEPIEVYSTSFRPMQTAFAGRPDRVLMKLVVSQESRKVLGCHIVAPNAGEMIQLAGIAVKMGATKEDFDRTVAVHPTMSEEIVTMRKPTRSA
ncbi:FAD-dependent oxidoreductase [Salipiger bermudensis]|uniref:Glutathione-disulfide reductase n=1 Tax=Salipiger bermudensis (strain DSM 26914 / JCM 13377 / KCTC 12554 / HTCC2601) TaxID=314265 RepID=Q0FIQ0_SALBH|nr:FAD-dependent oxidoreductase [Salipiger bermudensis]EAU44094.1 glutathione-disulfide reductase [Salipiger bermudensis HTCC2601]MBN9674499.1 FAD-dependent oxidoreductase [Salipiger bermudensis]MBR9892219.1 FAD-dependent oxidoreductase [bacterium]MCA1284939.1 FAD-dependent oxidoreductase [Salipiger bermudensis]